MIRKLIAITYTRLLRPILFRFNPETVHNLFTLVGRCISFYPPLLKSLEFTLSYQNKSLNQIILGLRFKNPVGLSEGFDKEGYLPKVMKAIGFGFTQIGSVTYEPYSGNQKPRLYRLPKSKAVVVNFGLKNSGVQKIMRRVKKYKLKDFPYSFSVAKTNSIETKTDKQAIADYIKSLEALEQTNTGSFYTINISCPNTFGGEPFTTPAKLNALLKKINELKIIKPVFIKMPINLKWKDFDELLKIIIKYRMDGVIIGNLNKDHDDSSIIDSIPGHIKGGISGKPTWELSNQLIASTYKKYKEQLIIIGTGGIFSADDAYHKICLGASLVQLITGMIYEGPQLPSSINKGIVKLLKEDGFTSIREAIGSKNK